MIAGRAPVVVNSFYNAYNVNAGKFPGSEPRSMVDTGVYSHSGGGAGAVPVMDFEEKLRALMTSYRGWLRADEA